MTGSKNRQQFLPAAFAAYIALSAFFINSSTLSPSRGNATIPTLAETRAENAALGDKVRVLEAELVRLRKDRRELETYLLGKIKALGEGRDNG